MPRFSIVVPVYNTASYLPACLDSVLEQTFEDWEAIVVNDASPDASASIIEGYAERDNRFKSLVHEANKGLHMARKDGTAVATGDYVLYLDSDDTYEPDFLEKLDEALSQNPADILHYGQRAIASCGTPQKTADDYTANEQRAFPPLEGDEILYTVFDEKRGYKRDWIMIDRAFERSLVQEAFEAMADERLSRAEDAYEYFVIASKARKEVTRNDIVGYLYYLGRGIINFNFLSVEKYLSEARLLKRCYELMFEYASETDPDRLSLCAEGAKTKLLEFCTNDWLCRIPRSQQVEAAYRLADVIGRAPVATNLMRFVRDDVYEAWDKNEDLEPGAAWEFMYDLAREVYDPNQATEAQRDQYDAMAAVVEGHLRDVRHRTAERAGESPAQQARDSQAVRILVSAHREFASFDSNVLQMIQVGSAIAPARFAGMLHDDTGENDSVQNKMLCEVTAQYWAWKNLDCEYVGFCHYRRYFNFSGKKFKENGWGEVMDGAIDAETQAKYGLDDATIESVVRGYDLLHSPIQELKKLPQPFNTPYDQYKAAPKLHIEDLELMARVAKELAPDYAEDVDAYLKGDRSCFCNMYVMRKPLFDEYAAWLFPILERCIEEMDFSRYSVEAVRTPGHLAERLFNIWLVHQNRVNPELKTGELQVVHFEDPNPEPRVEPLPAQQPARAVVPVVFAADNNYVPMVSTTIVSMLENASRDYDYDITVLQKDISGDNQAAMQAMVAQYPGAHLRFVSVGRIIEKYKLTTNNPHISVETYYRFLIQELLPFYTKVLYLDSDLIVTGDVSELYKTDVSDVLLAAARDVDYLGNLNMKDGNRLRYSERVLGLKNPYDYFQAGVLVLNTEAMRQLMPMDEWLKKASNTAYIYNDQDVLNACCEGRVRFLDNAWNVMTDCAGRVANVFSFAPADVFNDYLRARGEFKIMHYAGFEKPWSCGHCDMAVLYWEYARKMPFYERLLALQAGVAPSRGGARVPAKAMSDTNPLRRFIDPLMPLGTNRREVAKAIGRAIRGRN